MTQMMQAAFLVECGQPMVFREVPIPAPPPGHLLVKMETCGLCHTDLHFWKGEHPLPRELPVILGHEGIGTVAALGEGVSYWDVGQRVGVGFVFGTCGHCKQCLTGHETHCDHVCSTGVHVDGCFSEYAILREDWATAIPEGLESLDASPLLCAGVAAYSAVRKPRLEPGELAAVFGTGGLGSYAIQVAKDYGAHVAAVDVSREKLDHALRLGADYGFLASEDPAKSIKELGGADACFNFAPVSASWRQMLESAAPRARLVLISLPTDLLAFEAGEVIESGLCVMGSADGTRQELRQLMKLAGSGKVSSVIEAVPFSRINEAFERLASGQVQGRLVLDMRAA
jgi:propanol-preferring alcohol dehydrogenase